MAGRHPQNQAGVPKRQVLLEQGYTAAQVEDWGYTVEEPNGPEPDLENMGAFEAAQQAPVRPEREERVRAPAVRRRMRLGDA